MNVGFAVRHHDHFIARQLVVQQLADGAGAPLRRAFLADAPLFIDLAQYLVQVPHQRLRFPGRLRPMAAPILDRARSHALRRPSRAN